MLGAASGEAQLRQIDAEAKLAERDLREAEAAWARIRGALANLVRLSSLVDVQHPGILSALQAARQALEYFTAGKAVHEALRGRGAEVQDLVDMAKDLDALQTSLDDIAHGLQDEVRRLELELQRTAGSPSRTGGAMLSREVMALLKALDSAGIPAVPLCDVVGVAEADWQYAAEALLGRGREAIIVEPPLLARAFDLMWQNRNAYAGCTLVKTSATASTRTNTPPGSILEALRTDDQHAMAFLTVRIGALRKAEQLVGAVD